MDNVSHPFSLRFEALGFLFRSCFFLLFRYPMGFEKPSILHHHLGSAAGGAFRHHGAVDGITRCLGDGGHSPPWSVGVGWGDEFGLVREVITVFQMEIILGKKHVIINGLEIKRGYSIVIGGCTSGFGLVGRMGCC